MTISNERIQNSEPSSDAIELSANVISSLTSFIKRKETADLVNGLAIISLLGIGLFFAVRMENKIDAQTILIEQIQSEQGDN